MFERKDPRTLFKPKAKPKLTTTPSYYYLSPISRKILLLYGFINLLALLVFQLWIMSIWIMLNIVTLSLICIQKPTYKDPISNQDHLRRNYRTFYEQLADGELNIHFRDDKRNVSQRATSMKRGDIRVTFEEADGGGSACKRTKES